MPNYYAHLTFGQAVLERLSAPVRQAVDRQRQGFDCGLYGPDPLFFYHNGIPSRAEREAHRLHEGTPQIALERLRSPIQAHMPYALGYALGYLCHYLLDRACHPFVYANCSAQGISHMAMEGEFDRFLMRRDGIDPHAVTPLKRPDDARVFAAAASAYETVDEKGYRVAMAGFYRVSRALTLFQGSVFCPLVDLITCKSNSAAKMLLHRNPSPLAARTNVELLNRWEAAADTAVLLVEALYEACLTDGPLDFLPTENFQGKPLMISV
ncbi:MAG: hypothetical protein LUD79_09510 [Oscillospiraceae bacterium]|nr:hypothetical protein [Oscillospiraceae bacterium]